jgi:hypothetical protein
MLLVAADAAVRRARIRNNNGQSAGLSGAAAMSSAMNISGSALKSRVGANRNKHATRRMLGRCDGMAWVHHWMSSGITGDTAEGSRNAHRAAHWARTNDGSISSAEAAADEDAPLLPRLSYLSTESVLELE